MSLIENTNNYEYFPKIGEKKVFTFKGGAERVENAGHEKNFKKKGGVDAGFHYLFDVGLPNKLLLNTWCIYYDEDFKKIQAGDTIEINHVGQGDYKIKQLDKAPETNWDE